LGRCFRCEELRIFDARFDFKKTGEMSFRGRKEVKKKDPLERLKKVLDPRLLSDLEISDTEAEDVLGSVFKVHVRFGRHVEFIAFEFVDGSIQSYGDESGGSGEGSFEIEVEKGEFLVRVVGRQKKHLDGVQFVTNLGTSSQWFGGDGGNPFQKRATEGKMIVGLKMEDSAFCPRMEDILVSEKPPPLRSPGFWHLMFHKNVRNLVFSGNPSLFKMSRRGRPSVMFLLLLKQRGIVFRKMLKGKPSFLRLLMEGEELSNPSSLFRTLCEPMAGDMSAMELLLFRDPEDRRRRSIGQLYLEGRVSVARKFFGRRRSGLPPLINLFFQKDPVNGFPPLARLLTVRDKFEGKEFPSILECVLAGEERGDSLSRLLFSGQPSIMDMYLEGEVQGKKSILRRFMEDRGGHGLSILRMMFTSFDNHKGHRQALSTYVFGAGESEKPSILRLMLSADARPDSQMSLMRLLMYKKKKHQKSLLELMTAGSPSIIDLFFQGELTGEDSLARLVLGTSVEFRDNVLHLGAALKPGNANGVSLMHLMLLGEEDNGPGISFMRLFLFGEHEDGVSVLRLLLYNENSIAANEPSILRVMITVVKAMLIAAKTRPSQFGNGEWLDNVRKVGAMILSSQKTGKPVTMKEQLDRFIGAINKQGNDLQSLMSVLQNINKSGKEFREQWRRQFLRVARELELAGERASDDSVWARMAPKWKKIAEAIARQQWAVAGNEIGGIFKEMRTVQKFAERLQSAASAFTSASKQKQQANSVLVPGTNDAFFDDDSDNDDDFDDDGNDDDEEDEI